MQCEKEKHFSHNGFTCEWVSEWGSVCFLCQCDVVNLGSATDSLFMYNCSVFFLISRMQVTYCLCHLLDHSNTENAMNSTESLRYPNEIFFALSSWKRLNSKCNFFSDFQFFFFCVGISNYLHLFQCIFGTKNLVFDNHNLFFNNAFRLQESKYALSALQNGSFSESMQTY